MKIVFTCEAKDLCRWPNGDNLSEMAEAVQKTLRDYYLLQFHDEGEFDVAAEVVTS